MAIIIIKLLKSSYRSVLSGLLLFLKSIFNEIIFKELFKELLNDIFYSLLIKSYFKLF